jgi:ribosomal protein S25
MRWFRGPREPDVWEAVDTRPLGDIEAAQRIREICASAGSIAEKLTLAGGRNAEAEKASASERYQAAIKRALEIAMKISDDSMRDVSVSQIISLCVMVDHMKTARILVRAIKSETTRGDLIAENPALRS